MKKNPGIVTVVILLLFFLLNKLSTHDVDLQNILTRTSPYFPKLPNKYVKYIQTEKSGYYCFTIEDFACREFILVKSSPNNDERIRNFDLEIFFSNHKKKDKKIENTAALYKYNDTIYGIFKEHLPFTDINKIVIKHRGWKDSIIQPFSSIKKNKFNYPFINKTGNKLSPSPYLPVFITGLKFYNISYLPYSYTKNNEKLFQVFYDLDSYIDDKQQTIGSISNMTNLSKLIDKKHFDKKKTIHFKGKYKNDAITLTGLYLNDSISLNKVFDLQKLTNFIALKELFSNNDCNEKIYFKYNPETKLIEPFFTSTKCLNDLTGKISQPKIKNKTYLDAYLHSLSNISKINIENDLIKQTKNLKEELILINRYYPEKIFNEDIIKIKQKVIKKSLDIEKMLITELVSFNNNIIELRVKNFSDFPIQITGLKYKNKNLIRFHHTVKANKIDTITGSFPDNFENLFVKKKSKNTGFKLYKDIYKMHLTYNLLNFNKNYRSEIIPYTQEEKLEKEDLFRKPIEIKKYNFLKIDTNNRIVTLKNSKLILHQVLRIPKDYTFKLTAGNEIDIRNGGKIISFAPLQFEGTQQKPIRIYSSDDKGQGIVVFADGKKSKLTHVIFDNLTNPEHGYWNVSGAVTFYESPVELTDVTISNNASEDGLNIVRTSFKMKNCTFKNTQSDAFDGDFVTGELSNSKFINSGNDAVDVSGSKIIINNITINKTGDKGLSAGEQSVMEVKNLTILNSEIGVASKDLSTVTIDNVVMENIKLAFTAFQKKPEFGPSKIIVKKADLKNIEKLHLIENNSVLSIEGKEAETIKNVKSKMYGVEFGVSSKVTRNKNRKK